MLDGYTRKIKTIPSKKKFVKVILLESAFFHVIRLLTSKNPRKITNIGAMAEIRKNIILKIPKLGFM